MTVLGNKTYKLSDQDATTIWAALLSFESSMEFDADYSEKRYKTLQDLFENADGGEMLEDVND